MPDLPRLPSRKPDSHKGDFGRALIIGGSRGMAGAAALSGMACLRSGAGLVKIAVARSAQRTVASFEPSYMTVGLAENSDGQITFEARDMLETLIEPSTAIGCGPGLGRSAEITELVKWLYRTVERPMVFDADALNALAERPHVLGKSAGPRILTPHPGEFARLLGVERIDAERREPLARELALQTGAVVVLKGHQTVITDGKTSALNTTGNPGMATGGTGDVLTGIITGLICQGMSPYDAARLGVHVHGLAGDLAAAELGQVGMIARDLVEYLPQAFQAAE